MGCYFSNTTIQSTREEIFNSLTHGLGILLGIAGLVLLVVFASLNGDAWRIVSFSVYGTTLVILYTSSTLYHSFSGKRVKNFFRFFDHSSIYLLIAGTYTPVLLISLRGPWGWTMFGLIWTMALAGIVGKIFLTGKMEAISIILYVVMGWLILIAFKPALEMVPGGLLIWLFIGGFSYTFGIIFYIWERLPYHHVVWHLFVLGGSISHFFGMFFYLTSTN